MEEINMQDLSINETTKLDIIFCSICHAPIEYCDYSSTPAECKSWLAANFPDEYKNLYGDIPEGTLEQPAGEAPGKKGKPAKSSNSAKVVITVIERTKRKRITQIRGLDRFNVNMKAAAKGMASKFAAAASVSKLSDGSGLEEILIQGDCADELIEYITKEFPTITEEHIEFQESKKK